MDLRKSGRTVEAIQGTGRATTAYLRDASAAGLTSDLKAVMVAPTVSRLAHRFRREPPGRSWGQTCQGR